ncbi:Tmem216 [Columba livia]|nr:Tmem216 [Columba livia]
MAPTSRQRSSAPLQVLLFLNGWYSATYFVLEALIFVYKVLLLPYPFTNLVLDVALLLIYLGTEATRIFFDSRALPGTARTPAVPFTMSPTPQSPLCVSPPHNHTPRRLQGQPVPAQGAALHQPGPDRARSRDGRVLPAAADLRPAPGSHPQRHPPPLLCRGGAAGCPGAVLLLQHGFVLRPHATPKDGAQEPAAPFPARAPAGSAGQQFPPPVLTSDLPGGTNTGLAPQGL